MACGMGDGAWRKEQRAEGKGIAHRAWSIEHRAFPNSVDGIRNSEESKGKRVKSIGHRA